MKKRFVFVTLLIAMVALTQIPVSLVSAVDVRLDPVSGSNCDPTTFEYDGHVVAEGFAVSVSADLPFPKITQIKFGGAVAGLGGPWEEWVSPGYLVEFTPYVKEMWVKVEGVAPYTAIEDTIYDNTGTGDPSWSTFLTILEGIGLIFTAYDIYQWLSKVYQEPPVAEWDCNGHWSQAIVRQKTEPGYYPHQQYVNPDNARLQTASANVWGYFEDGGSAALTITAEAEIYLQEDWKTTLSIVHQYIGTYSVSFEVEVHFGHNIAVTNVSASPTSVWVGESVTITVVAENEGGFTETFDVTAYYVEPIATPTSEQWDIFWSMGDVNEDGYIDVIDYNLIVDHAGTNDPQYDINEDDIVDSDDVMICACNMGLDIWTYFGKPHDIGEQTVDNLPAGNSITVTFTWNTAGVPAGTYPIKAVASTVLGETDTADNTYVDGSITLSASLYTLKILVSPSLYNPGTTDPPPGSYAYPYGTSVTVKATANKNWDFCYWKLDGQPPLGIKDNPITVTMNSDHSLRATFVSTETGGGHGGKR